MLFVLRESQAGGNVITKVIVNGLEREARNLRKVGAYGDSTRYQQSAYDSMQNEWAINVVNLGGTAEVWKLLSLVGGLRLFLFFKVH